MRPADRAWLVLAAGVTAWDLAGAETLSAAAGRYHHARPWLTRTVIAYLAAHLLGLLPRSVDVLTYLADSSAIARRRTGPPSCPN